MVQQNIRVKICKAMSLLLAAISLGLGVRSHYGSDWLNHEISVPLPPQGVVIVTIPVYKICELECSQWTICSDCPSISMERFFVGTVTACVVLSLILLLARVATHVDGDSRAFFYVEVCHHAGSAVLLLIAGALYITSAKQIQKSFNLENPQTGLKIAAGSVAILQAHVYGVVALYVIKS